MSTKSQTIHFLHVDDELDFSAMAAEFLQRADDRIVVDTAVSANDGIDRLTENGYDCVISDYDMPGQNGIEFLKALRENNADLPFILYTGKGSEEVAAEAISASVTDYLQKKSGTDQYAVLANRALNAVERHRAEQAAERTRSRLEAIAANSTDVIVTIDSESRILFINDAVDELLGYSPEELEGKSLTALMPTRHQDNHAASIDRYLQTGDRTFNWRAAEFEALHRNGDEVPVSISFGEFEEDGKQRFVGIIHDITERKAHELTLRQEMERFELLVGEVGTHAIFMLDPDGHIVSWNEGARHIKGYTDAEINGEHFSTLYTESDVQDGLPERMLAKAIEAGRAEDEGWRVRKDGTQFWAQVSITALYDDAGDLRGFGKVTRDMTEWHEQHEQFESLIEHSSDLITVLDEDGTITYQSPSIERILGYAPEALLGEPAINHVHPDDQERVLGQFTEMIESPEQLTHWERYRFQHKDGSWVWLETVGTNRKAGTLDGYVINTRDVSDQRALEVELEEALHRYQTTVEQNLAGIYLLRNDRFEYVNPKFCEITGYDEDDFSSMDAIEIVAPESRDEVRENIEKRLSGGLDQVEYSAMLARKDGERREVRANGSRIEIDGEPAILGTIVDIKEQVERHKRN